MGINIPHVIFLADFLLNSSATIDDVEFQIEPFLPVGINTYLLLAECEVRTASYGPSFFLPFMAQARSARAMKTRREKTRIHNLPYGPSKRG